MSVLQRGHSGDGCDLALILCQYDLRKGDLVVLNWERVRRVRQRSIYSELIMGSEGVRSILLSPLLARCLDTIDVCLWHMIVFMSIVVTVTSTNRKRNNHLIPYTNIQHTSTLQGSKPHYL